MAPGTWGGRPAGARAGRQAGGMQVGRPEGQASELAHWRRSRFHLSTSLKLRSSHVGQGLSKRPCHSVAAGRMGRGSRHARDVTYPLKASRVEVEVGWVGPGRLGPPTGEASLSARNETRFPILQHRFCCMGRHSAPAAAGDSVLADGRAHGGVRVR